MVGGPSTGFQKKKKHAKKKPIQQMLPGARLNKEVQPTLSFNLNAELTYSGMGNSEFSGYRTA